MCVVNVLDEGILLPLVLTQEELYFLDCPHLPCLLLCIIRARMEMLV